MGSLVRNLAAKLWVSFTSHREWDHVIEDLKGVNSIPIMTIHKSKGLEYHTVIFIGLEDAAFWNFVNETEADKRAFFVAFSRAKEQVLFTYSESREIKHYFDLKTLPQSNDAISVLYRNLEYAGAKIVEFDREVVVT